MNKNFELIIYKIDEHQISAFESFLKNLEEDAHDINFIYNYKSITSYTKKGSKNTYISLIHWKNNKTMPTQLNQSDFNITHDLIITAEDGWTDDFVNHLNQAPVVEFGIRKIKSQDKSLFFKRRKEFLSLIHENQGAIFDQELKTLQDKANIMLFGWQSQAAFQKGAKTAFSSFKALHAMIKYFPLVKQEAFQVGIRI